MSDFNYAQENHQLWVFAHCYIVSLWGMENDSHDSSQKGTSWPYWFLIAALTNYRHLSGLKNPQIYYLTVLEVWSPKWVSQNWNQGVSRAAFPGSSRRESASPSFRLLEASQVPWTEAPSISKASKILALASAPTVTSPLKDSPASLILEEALWLQWAHQIILGNLPISRSLT